MVDKVTGLEGVGEGYPGQVSKREHEPEAVVDNVHGGEDGFLGPEPVPHVEPLEGAHQDHGDGHVTVQLVLLGHHAVVDEDPPYQARPELAEDLPVEARARARVKLSPDEPVVYHAARVPAFRQQGALSEGLRVKVDGHDEGEKGGRRGQGEVVVVHKGNRDLQVVGDGEEDVGDDESVGCVHLVLEDAAVSQFGPLHRGTEGG